MTRQRWFCAVCGALTINPEQPDGRAYCRAHSDLPALDEVAPDPLESLPTMEQEIQALADLPAMFDGEADFATRKATADAYVAQLRKVTAARAREALHPANGTEA